MEFIIMYLWSMLGTAVIALGNNCEPNGVFLPLWAKVLLLLPLKSGRKAPMYLVIIRAIIQVVSIVCLALILTESYDSQTVRKIYGGVLVSGAILATAICRYCVDRHG